MKKSTISLGLRNFIKKYSPLKVFVVNLSIKQKIKIKNTEINFVYPFEIKKILRLEF